MLNAQNKAPVLAQNTELGEIESVKLIAEDIVATKTMLPKLSNLEKETLNQIMEKTVI